MSARDPQLCRCRMESSARLVRRNINRLHVSDIIQATLFAERSKSVHGLRISAAGIGIADIGCEEINVTLAGPRSSHPERWNGEASSGGRRHCGAIGRTNNGVSFAKTFHTRLPKL